MTSADVTMHTEHGQLPTISDKNAGKIGEKENFSHIK